MSILLTKAKTIMLKAQVDKILADVQKIFISQIKAVK